MNANAITFSTAATDAVRFWERGRLFYNGLLLVVVAARFGAEWPESRELMSADWGVALFLLVLMAVAANFLYCAGYPVDLFLQYTTYRDRIRAIRWSLFAAGTGFAALLAWRLSEVMFLPLIPF